MGGDASSDVVIMKFCVGHESKLLHKPTIDGNTHEWKIFVRPCGPLKFDDRSVISQVRFSLHPTFHNPERVVKNPPFEVKETGYGGFMLPVYVTACGQEFCIQYDFQLSMDGFSTSSISHRVAVRNPTPYFIQRLAKYCPNGREHRKSIHPKSSERQHSSREREHNNSRERNEKRRDRDHRDQRHEREQRNERAQRHERGKGKEEGKKRNSGSKRDLIPFLELHSDGMEQSMSTHVKSEKRENERKTELREKLPEKERKVDTREKTSEKEKKTDNREKMLENERKLRTRLNMLAKERKLETRDQTVEKESSMDTREKLPEKETKVETMNKLNKLFYKEKEVDLVKLKERLQLIKSPEILSRVAFLLCEHPSTVVSCSSPSLQYDLGKMDSKLINKIAAVLYAP